MFFKLVFYWLRLRFLPFSELRNGNFEGPLYTALTEMRPCTLYAKGCRNVEFQKKKQENCGTKSVRLLRVSLLPRTTEVYKSLPLLVVRGARIRYNVGMQAVL